MTVLTDITLWLTDCTAFWKAQLPPHKCFFIKSMPDLIYQFNVGVIEFIKDASTCPFAEEDVEVS